MDDIVKDFLIESNENLDRLDRELVKVESDPSFSRNAGQQAIAGNHRFVWVVREMIPVLPNRLCPTRRQMHVIAAILHVLA
jgi:hypothetical protein